MRPPALPGRLAALATRRPTGRRWRPVAPSLPAPSVVGAAFRAGLARAVAGTGSVSSHRSRGSVLSVGSVYSAASAWSLGSVGSLLSVASAGSILSIGSAGSVLSIGSTGSFLSVGATGGFCTTGARQAVKAVMAERRSAQGDGSGAGGDLADHREAHPRQGVRHVRFDRRE